MKIGIIGVGIMGSNHARVLSEMKDVDELIISDINKAVLDNVGEKFNINKRYVNHKEMLKNEEIDGVVIAVPPAYHKKTIIDCIEHGIKNILVEKPITHNIEDAKEVIEIAKKKKVFLTVGHIERYNPVVTKIKELINKNLIGEIYLINTIRVGPFPKRLFGFREGVLIDLAVHDIDIIRYLTGEIKQVHSQIISNEKQEIYAKCLFKINKKIKGSSEFSWVSPKRKRAIEIFGTKGMLKGDYQNQKVWFYENYDAVQNQDTTNYYKFLLEGNISSGNIIQYQIKKKEPLQVELLHFIDCIKKNKKSLVSPEDALVALSIAISAKNADL